MKKSLGRRAALLALAATAFLAGCAQVPRQAFNAQGAASVKKVVIARPDNQKEYPTIVIGHPGASFGLIGGLIAAADMQGKTNKFTAAVKPDETRVQEHFGATLKHRLEEEGYQPTEFVMTGNTTPEQAVTQAKQRFADADAVVYVNVSAGYTAAGPKTDYFPNVRAKVKTIDTHTGKVLYEDTISYGYAAAKSETVHLASDASYRFNDIDALVMQAAKAREALLVGADAVATQIATDLKK